MIDRERIIAILTLSRDRDAVLARLRDLPDEQFLDHVDLLDAREHGEQVSMRFAGMAEHADFLVTREKLMKAVEGLSPTQLWQLISGAGAMRNGQVIAIYGRDKEEGAA